MAIKDVGELKTGNVSEVQEGMVRLYDVVQQYPVIELYGFRDECGNLLDGEHDIMDTATELMELWNRRVRGEI